MQAHSGSDAIHVRGQAVDDCWDTGSNGTDVVMFDALVTVEYSGCQDGLPVLWCQTSGQGHSRQDGLSGPAFWGLFESQ